MLWVPQKGVLLVEHNVGAVGDVTPGTQVTTGAASTTKGAVAEIFASTAFDAYWIEIMAMTYGAGATDAELAIDIMVGAATEHILIPDLLGGENTIASYSTGGVRWAFPLYIPAGTRLSAQAAGDRVSTAFSLLVRLSGGLGYPPFRVGTKVTTYGMGTVPAGTAIVPGASAAEGAWTQIVASTTEDHFAFFPSFQRGLDTTKADRIYFVDMGHGAATEELMVGGESYIYMGNGNEAYGGPMWAMPAFQDVPSGTRLVMRASNSGTNEDGYNGVIHAVS